MIYSLAVQLLLVTINPLALYNILIEVFVQIYLIKQYTLQHYQSPLFGILKPSGKQEEPCLPESQALCLPVSIEELLHANELGAVSTSSRLILEEFVYFLSLDVMRCVVSSVT